MKLWAVQQRNGDVMLTALRPGSAEVRGTGVVDWYVQHGDPIGVRNLCPSGFKALTGVDVKQLFEPVQIELTGGLSQTVRTAK
jgi:hypothetical protein